MSHIFYLLSRNQSFKMGTDLCKDIWWYATLLKNHDTIVLFQGGQRPTQGYRADDDCLNPVVVASHITVSQLQ